MTMTFILVSQLQCNSLKRLCLLLIHSQWPRIGSYRGQSWRDCGGYCLYPFDPGRQIHFDGCGPEDSAHGRCSGGREAPWYRRPIGKAFVEEDYQWTHLWTNQTQSEGRLEWQPIFNTQLFARIRLNKEVN
jgi:hypothetical protein